MPKGNFGDRPKADPKIGQGRFWKTGRPKADPKSAKPILGSAIGKFRIGQRPIRNFPRPTFGKGNRPEADLKIRDRPKADPEFSEGEKFATLRGRVAKKSPCDFLGSRKKKVLATLSRGFFSKNPQKNKKIRKKCVKKIAGICSIAKNEKKIAVFLKLQLFFFRKIFFGCRRPKPHFSP